MLYALIMAGGRGTRFWPASRTRMPKQLLPLLDGQSILGHTVLRMDGLVEPESILIATNAAQADAVRSCAPSIPESNIIVEPDCRDTAPCIALASALIARRDPDAVLLVAPSDHVIRSTEQFRHTIEAAAELAARDDAIFVFGVRPQSPSTAYGYIQRGNELPEQRGVRVFEAARFTEKPDREKATGFLDSGDYYWNSGLYLFRVSTVLEELRRQAPEIAESASRIADAAGTPEEASLLGDLYPRMPKISIDYAVTEHAPRVRVLEVDYFWSDIGSWTALADLRDPDENGNIVHAAHVGIDTTGCIVWQRDEHVVATIGVSNLVIIHTEDATLVCDAARVQDVKSIVEMLAEEGMDSLL